MEEDKLRPVQLEELNLLLELRRVCGELGLRYYLTAGTLLGAVRHKGFIPWDDDIDVAMPRRDYERLAKLGPRCFHAGYIYQEYRTEPNFPYYFAKLRRRGTRAEEPVLRAIEMEQGYYIDIFPLDRCPGSDRLAKLFFKGIELLDCAVLARVSPEFVCGYQKPCVRFLWNGLRRLPNGAIFALREGVRKLSGLGGRRLCTVGGRHGYPRETYQPEWFAQVAELEFEGISFPAPAGWEALLKNMYGDYMTPPPPEERQGHFLG
ncbi:MAG: LicD family protein [Lawsonibacter sp.]|nr:LicD family protein [Lawsonibacter sp.]